MYPVSNDYLAAIIRGSVTTYWYGTVKTKNGETYSIDEETIAQGSGRITRELVSGDNLDIGTTCSAGLDISLYLNVDRYALYEAIVTLTFKLKTGADSWEDVPIGKFYVVEPPERAYGMITLHALDAMCKFDKDFGSTLIGSPYSMLQYACLACGVELGSSQSDITNMPNGNVDTYTYEETTINTYRDLVGYIASYLGGYAYIGVDDKLYIAQYNMDAVRTITEDWRFNYTPCDYETFYTSLEAYFMVTKETESFTTGMGDGLTYNLGGNPLIQFNLDATRHSVLNNILNEIASIKYTPFKATVPCDPALTIGDVLNFTGNHAVDGKLSAITKQVITIKGSMEIECAGTDPRLNVLTSTQKEIAAAGKSSNKDGMYYYDFINAKNIHIDDGETAVVTVFNYVTSKATHIDYHGQIKLLVDTTEQISEDQTACYENDGTIIVTYFIDDHEVAEYHPQDAFFDGDHLLDLLYFFFSSGNLTSTLEVKITCEGCSVDIETGCARGYIAGVGLVGDSAWDGSVKVSDEIIKIDFHRIHKQMTDEATVNPVTPAGDTATDNVVKRVFRPLKAFTSAVDRFVRLHKFDVPYNSADMTYDNIKTQDNKWVLNNTSQLGMVTTPNCINTPVILNVKSKCSGLNVFYIVSFDNGSTWWTYNNGWAAPDYTQDVYGMFKSTLEAITQAQWALKLSGQNQIMIRAVLIDSIASLTDIEIFTSVEVIQNA